jgi:hypothetical protein
VALAQVQDLAHEDDEEGEPVLHLDQRLRLRHPHAGAEPAVELQHNRLVERRVAGLRQLRCVGKVRERLDLRLPQQALVALAQELLVVGEGLDGDPRDGLALAPRPG